MGLISTRDVAYWRVTAEATDGVIYIYDVPAETERSAVLAVYATHGQHLRTGEVPAPLGPHNTVLRLG